MTSETTWLLPKKLDSKTSNHNPTKIHVLSAKKAGEGDRAKQETRPIRKANTMKIGKNKIL